MRKKVSFLLSLVMVLSMLPANVLQAAAKKEFKLNYLANKGIIETKEGLVQTEISKDAEEATFEWSIEDDGYYELVYYSEQIKDNPNQISKITLGFEVGKGKDDKTTSSIIKPDSIYVTGKIEKYNAKSKQYEPLDLVHYRYEFPYIGKSQQTNGKVFVSEMSKNPADAQSLKELSVKLGKSLLVRAFTTKEETLKVWVNGINKGYVTDFSLSYANAPGETAAYTSKLVVFPGISNTKISSTHLEVPIQTTTSGALKSVETIYEPERVKGAAGSKPGIKFEFERPKVRIDNEFKYIDEKNGGSNLKTTVNLETKLEADDSSNQIQVNFDLGGKNPVTGNIVPKGETKKIRLEKIKETDTDANKMTLYFSRDPISDVPEKENIITWPALQESMVIGGEITISGSITVDNQKHEISTGNVALDTGYTYLKYEPEQTNIGETTLLITPYKYKGEITYQVYYVNGDNVIDENKALFGSYKFTYDPSYPNRKLEISIPTNEISKFRIKALLSQESQNATSQDVVYNPKDGSIIISPYTPQIREVNNIYVIPDTQDSQNMNTATDVEAAGFDIVWSAPSEEKLKQAIGEQGKLYFELNLLDSNKGNKALIAVFEASLQGGNVVVKQLGNAQGTVVYDKDKEQFRATQVMLKDMEKVDWEKINLPGKYESGTSYPNIEYEKNGYFAYKIPNSFYLTMRTVLDPSIEPSSTTSLKVSTNESILYPLTLDKTNELLPAPSRISSVSTETEATDTLLRFNNVSIKKFVDYMLKPGKWNIIGSNQNTTLPGTYEVVLYQESYLDSSNQKQQNDISDKALEAYIDKNDSKIFTVPEILTTTSSTLNVTLNNEAAINALREGKIVKFNYRADNLDGEGNIEVKFLGLDPNQSYYVRVRTVVESKRVKGGETKSRTDESLFSKIYGFTTITASKPIRPDEEIPPAPKNFKAEAKDNSTAILTWQDPDIKIEEGKDLKYEIIRVTSQKLDEQLISKRDLTASEIIRAEGSKNAVLLEDYELVNVDGEIFYRLIDPTLQPNTVYYYYIRTVYNGAYSEWIYQPVTTPNIEKPISLKAYNATKSTVDISFLAKVPYDLIPGTYDFTIAIQGEGDTGWTTVSSSNLSRLNNVSSPPTEEGYYFYEYRISGLKAGRRYNIKVAVVDKSKEMIDGKYQQSLYSDIVSIRTEYDEDEQIQDDKFKEYLDKFDKEAEKLKNKAYWTVESGSVYKYRASYINSDMALSKQYQLVSEGNTNNVSYYLPASVIEQMNNVGVTLEIVLGDQSVNIRPQTILSTTKEIKEAILLKQERTLADYYVVINVSKNKYTGNINGEEAISPKINIEMDVAYLRQEDILMEADILEALNEIIQNERKSFITDLERKIKNGVIADDVLQGIIDGYMEDIKKEHVRDVSKIMKNQVKKEISIEQIAKSMLITHKSSHTSINAYYYKKGWVQVETYSSGDSAYIEAIYLGTYIFTGGKDLIESVPTLAPYQNFINQYKLDEFFTLDSYMIKTAVSKGQVYGALARVMGAPAGSDYMTYLTSKGVKGVSRLGSNNYIRQDEAIYLVMQGYEMLHHRKVETIVIKNKQSLTNIGAFQPIYRPYVYAAVELKIIDNPNSKALPSKQMSAEEMIKMLYKIQV